MDVLPLSFFSAKITKTAWNRLAVGKLVVARGGQARPVQNSTKAARRRLPPFLLNLRSLKTVTVKLYNRGSSMYVSVLRVGEIHSVSGRLR